MAQLPVPARFAAAVDISLASTAYGVELPVPSLRTIRAKAGFVADVRADVSGLESFLSGLRSWLLPFLVTTISPNAVP
jgi:hypothetical protein